MKASEIRNLSEREIEEKINSLRKDLYGLTYDNQVGRVEQPHRMSLIKKDIARCMTILREKTGKNPSIL